MFESIRTLVSHLEQGVEGAWQQEGDSVACQILLISLLLEVGGVVGVASH